MRETGAGFSLPYSHILFQFVEAKPIQSIRGWEAKMRDKRYLVSVTSVRSWSKRSGLTLILSSMLTSTNILSTVVVVWQRVKTFLAESSLKGRMLVYYYQPDGCDHCSLSHSLSERFQIQSPCCSVANRFWSAVVGAEWFWMC
jgi:hypothetical protein